MKLPCRKSTRTCAAYDTKRMTGVRYMGGRGPRTGKGGTGTCEISSGVWAGAAEVRGRCVVDHGADPTGKEVGSNTMRGYGKERPGYGALRTWTRRTRYQAWRNKTDAVTGNSAVFTRTSWHSPSEVRPPRVSCALNSSVCPSAVAGEARRNARLRFPRGEQLNK